MFKINYDTEFNAEWTPYKDLCRTFIEDTVNELCCAEISGEREWLINEIMTQHYRILEGWT